MYHSDREEGPVVGPVPHRIEFENETINFHECAIKFEYSDRMLLNIVEIYQDVTFGKNYSKRCSGILNPQMGEYFSNGKKIMKVNIHFNGSRFGLLPEGFDKGFEEYKLSIAIDGNIKISANHYPGVVRALDTLSQLIVKDEKHQNEFFIEYVPINIHDLPDYAYRGVLLDTSREYFFPETIKQMLDGMMLARLNVFHWHFIDSDSIPMYSESYPNMTDYTAFSKREIYTPEMVKDIVNYAKIRGIKVVPEFEGPGHLNALGHYPEFADLIACYSEPSVDARSHGAPPNAPIDPTNNKTYEFLDNFMKDMRKSFDSEYWHLGGDQVEISCWNNLESVKEYIKNGSSEIKDLQQIYVDKEREIVSKIDSKIQAGYWYNLDRLNYKKGDILQYWGTISNMKREISSEPNNMFVLSPHDAYYLDCGYPDQFGKRSWCHQMSSWKTVWNLNPDSYNANKNVIGGEVCAWSEMNNEFDFLTKIFPRSGAMSYKYWNTGQPSMGGTQHEILMRLQYRLKAYGVPTEKISMRYCEEHTHHCFGK